MNTIVDFSPMAIKNASVQFLGGETQEAGKKFGCMGTLSATTEVREIVKRCEGDEQVITIPRYMTVNVGAHVKRDIIREVFGVSTTGLKAGVHSYGVKSKGKRFVFTADVIDEFEDIVQLIAFAKCSNMTGFSISIDNDADDVAYMDLEFRANADTLRNFYYEAFVEGLDEAIKTGWHTAFKPELVVDTTPEG